MILLRPDRASLLGSPRANGSQALEAAPNAEFVGFGDVELNHGVRVASTEISVSSRVPSDPC